MCRLFKPGDRVQLRSGGPIMEVIKYAICYSPWLGNYTSNDIVECVWYDPDEGRKKGRFHQKNLVKTTLHYPLLSSKGRSSNLRSTG